jgi:Tfp pilus assembly protein PilF
MNEISASRAVQEKQETEINLCLAGAQLARNCGEHKRAEKMYRRALKWAIQRWGKKSANVGVILLELQEFYESQGADIEAARVEGEVNSVLRHYFFEALVKLKETAEEKE